MSLFMNMVEHPEIFMNTEDIPTRNQRHYQYDSFAELMKTQEKVNISLKNSFQLLEKIHLEHQHLQTNKWEEISEELSKLAIHERKSNQFHVQVINRLNELDAQHKRVESMLNNETTLKEEFKKEMNRMIASHEIFITEKLNQFHKSHENLSNELTHLHKWQRTASEKVIEAQLDMNDRLERQEALMEKVTRQLTLLRSILYERTHDLAEKIEESYELTSAYLYQLLTGSMEPFSLFIEKKKKDEIK